MPSPTARTAFDWSRLNPAVQVRARFQRWWQARLRPSDSYTLTQRNVYILPTRPGLMLAATLLVLLLASINYQLNLGYLLTFLLAGCAVVGMHVSHATLRGTTLNLIAPNPCFTGDSVLIDVKLNNPGRSTRHGIGVRVLEGGQWSWTDVPAQGSSHLQVAWTAVRRGRTALPALTAETRFPMGTFRVWTIWRPAAQLLVYPRPEASPPPLPPGEPQSRGAASAASTSTDFDGVRGYRRGDPLKTIVWKKAARVMATGSGELVSRDNQQNQGYRLWLDEPSTGCAEREARLSRLCAWVLQADRQGLTFGLRLAQQDIPPSSGEAHKRQCLEALALC